MVQIAEDDENISIVGAKLIYPKTNRIQHAGIVFIRKIEPLHIYWLFRKEYAKSADSSTTSETSIALLKESIEEWFLSIPFPKSLNQISQEQLVSDLAYLAKMFLVQSSLRSKFGMRLMNQFSNDLEFDLRTLLIQCNYLFTDKN